MKKFLEKLKKKILKHFFKFLSFTLCGEQFSTKKLKITYKTSKVF